MAIDFDALFAAYARERMTVTDDTPEDEIEEAAYALYHDFLETPLAELDGRTTKEYAAELGTYGLLDEVLECTREGIKPTDHLLDCLLKDEAAAEAALCEVLYDDAITSAEGVFVIDLLMDLESRKPLLRYEEILLNEDADDALADAAAEAVIALNDGETAQELLRALPRMMGESTVRRICDVLSYIPVEGAFEALSAVFTASPDALSAQCLMRLGDPRGAEVLIDALPEAALRYGDYLAIREAAEALGAVVDYEREFYGDADYELMRGMMDE
ncbi:MAG: hypothetical protein E7328_06735 [Clostridiales bacterium]|nr:hypothetical protein [Clostridiales bacterium]